MSYIGKVPTAAPLTSSDIADGIITEAKMADDAISLTELKAGTDGEIISWDASGNPVAVGVGSDGQVLTSTGAGSPPAFEAAGGILLYSAASTVDATILTVSSTYITSTYRWYKIYLSGKVKTDDVTLRALNLVDGSAETGNCAHNYMNLSGADSGSGSTAYYALSHYETIGNNTNESFEAVIEYMNPTSTTLATTILYKFRYANTSDSNRGETGVARRNDGTTAHNGIKFYLSSGDFEEYAIAVYGFKV